MTRPVILTAEAQADIDDAHRWYVNFHPDLGAAFLTEFDRRIDRILQAPEQFPVVHSGLRKALLRRFPYAVFFRERGEAIEIIACFHASRDPSGWRRRS